MQKRMIRKCIIFGIIILFIGVNTNSLSTSKIGNNFYFESEEIQSIFWDNNMDYFDLVASQWDESIEVDIFQADDFHFENTKEIIDVHWIGGYWGSNYSQATFDWYISFMHDDGTGNSPDSHPKTPSFAGPFCYSWDEINKEFIEDTGSHIYYIMSVELPEVILFNGCEKFWISIWGEGKCPSYSGLGHHYEYLLNPAVTGSEFFNISFWTLGIEFFGYDFDLCFQLTGWPNLPPDPPDIDGPSKGKPGKELCWLFHSADFEEDDVFYYIEWGDGTFEDWIGPFSSCTPKEVCHVYEKKGTYNIRAKAKNIYGPESDWTEFEVEIPRSRLSNQRYICFLERFFMIERLLELIGAI